MDTMAKSLLAAASIIEDGELDGVRDERYAGWNGEPRQAILDGKDTLQTLHDDRQHGHEPQPSRAAKSARRLVARHIDQAR